jgi:phospholipid/cholesterol/gamma-HCH transport system substrate-binding protein
LKLSDEFKVGVLATFALLTLILGYSFLKGNNPFGRYQTFYVLYAKVPGLNASDPVLINGFKVGRVKAIRKMPDIRQGIIAELVLDNDIQLTRNTIAKIVSSDLLGEKAIELILDDSHDYLKSGDTLKSEVQMSLSEEVRYEILPVKQKATELMSSLDSLVTIIQVIVVEGQIEKTLQNLVKATGSFADVGKNLDSMVVREASNINRTLSNIEAITRTLKDNKDNIDRTLGNLAVLSDSLKRAELVTLMSNLSNVLKELKITIETINHGEGTVGLLIHKRDTYDALNNAINDLDKLLVDLKENPNRYVHFSLFGQNPNKQKKKK